MLFRSTWSLSAGTLPAGLTLSTAGVLSGTPTTAASSTFTVKVTDGAARTTTRSFTVVVAAPLSVSAATAAGATVGVAYSVQLAATGGTTPYVWQLSAGTLPNGLTLSTTGAITGTPTTVEDDTFTVQVTDAGGRVATKSLTITVVAPLAVSTTADRKSTRLNSSH